MNLELLEKSFVTYRTATSTSNTRLESPVTHQKELLDDEHIGDLYKYYWYLTVHAMDSTKTSIASMLENGDWDSARNCFETCPEMINVIDPLTGGTLLHRLCSHPPAPIDLYETVIKHFPDAVRTQEKTFQATPLHMLCWTSQRTTAKVELLLQHMHPDDLKIRNMFGGTALHSACGSQASIDVIKLIVQKNPSIISEKTYDYNHTALSALWQTHLQSIQGHMQIARILKGDDVNESHFDLFWEKVVFLAKEGFYQSPYCPDNLPRDSTDFALHGLIHLRAPLNLLKVALRRHPEWASIADSDGNYPLHVVVIRRPFRLKDKEIIQMLLQVYPKAAGERNNAGDSPIFIGVRDKMAWDEGLKEIVQGNTDVLGTSDTETGLYPFLLASSLDGRNAVETSYQLLCERPDLVKQAIF